MTTWHNFRDIAERTYSAAGSPRQISGTIPNGSTVSAIQIILSRPIGGWPVGGTYVVDMSYPDGSSSSVTFAGGDINDRFGNPLTASTAEWSKTGGFPPGVVTATLSNDKAVTTAVQINWS